MTRASGWTLVMVALAGVAAASLGIGTRMDAARDGVPTVEVHPGPFVHEIRAEGNFKEVESTPLTVPIEPQGNYKIAWLADDGVRVRAGDPVVRFDPTEMKDRLADGRADARTAESKLEKARVESGAQLGNLDLDAKQAGLELDASRRFAKKDAGIFARSQIVESAIDEELAMEKQGHALGTRKTRESLSRTDEDLLAIERKKAVLKIEQAEAGLSATEIAAPHDGIVLLERDWRGNEMRVGQQVWNGQPVARIPRLEAMQAEVYVLEADAGGLSVGDVATVRIEAHPEVVLGARVKRLDSLAKPRFKGVPVQYFGVTLELDRSDPLLMKPGGRVRATIRSQALASVLSVPHQAVFDRDGRKQLWRRLDGSFEQVAIETGAASAARVVVTRGLRDGDIVALRDPGVSPAPAVANASGQAGEPAAGRLELPR